MECTKWAPAGLRERREVLDSSQVMLPIKIVAENEATVRRSDRGSKYDGEEVDDREDWSNRNTCFNSSKSIKFYRRTIKHKFMTLFHI